MGFPKKRNKFCQDCLHYVKLAALIDSDEYSSRTETFISIEINVVLENLLEERRLRAVRRQRELTTIFEKEEEFQK